MSERERDALKRAMSSVSEVDPLTVSHPATVQTQDINGNVSVTIDDGGPLPGASNVPLVYGLPGIRCTVAQGARCRVSFDNGDPRKRIVTAFDEQSALAQCDVTSMNIANATPIQEAARKGDTVTCGYLTWEQLPDVSGLPVGGILSLYSPAGSTDRGATQWLIAGPIRITQVFPPDSAPRMDLPGVITSGSTIVKIGG